MTGMTMVLFDIDGTLVDGRGAGRHALDLAFVEEFGVPESGRACQGLDFAGAMDWQLHLDLAQRWGVPARQLEARRPQLQARYERHLRKTLALRGGTRLLAGAGMLVRHLARRPDVVLGLLTGNIEAGARIKLSPHGLNPLLPHGAFGDDETCRSRAAALARQRLERRLGRAVQRVVLVGDSPRDVEAARANGFQCVAVTTGWTSASQLEEAGALGVLAGLEPLADALQALDLTESCPSGR